MSEEPATKKCFVISPIGEPDSPTRKRADNVLRFVIQPAVRTCGYFDAERADAIGEPGIITSQIVERVKDVDLVVADLADANANVFYELAIRHIARKALVTISSTPSVRVPFDVLALRTIIFDPSDLASADDARARLEQHIREAEKNPQAHNPISVAIDLQFAKTTGQPQDALLANMAQQLERIQVQLSVLSESFPYVPGFATQFASLPASLQVSALSAATPFSEDVMAKYRGFTIGDLGKAPSVESEHKAEVVRRAMDIVGKQGPPGTKRK